jgi:Galactose oxidase, central domain/Kelch motif
MTPSKSRSRLPLLFLAAGLALALRCDGASPGFEETGSLAQARAFHTATLLPNGKVLVAGGRAWPFGDVPGSELYDPANRTWTSTGSLQQARNSHTATLLPNGKVLVAGGRVDLFEVATAELYDPASGSWTPTGGLNSGRFSHTATLLPNGKVLIAGGFVFTPTLSGGYAITSAELYDPVSGTWTITGSLDKQRYEHTATLLPNGNVLVAGSSGYLGYNPPASTELYHPANGTWTISGTMAGARAFHTATLLPAGRVLVAGGYGFAGSGASAELYDPASETWSPTGNLVSARTSHTATLLQNGKVLVAGGTDSSAPYVNARAELYDPSSGTWITTGSLITARLDHTATLLPDGNVLVAGGRNNDTSFGSAELYVRSTPTLLNISTRMRVQTGDKVLIGGFIITGTETKTVIVRGIGPSLPVAGALADPVIEVHGPSGEFLGSNDNWKNAATRQQISDSGLAPSNDLESALWGTINPGAYTVILSGKDGGTGVGSVEVYDLDEAADSRLANISSRGFVDTGDNAMIGGLIVGGGSPTGTVNVIVRALGPSVPVTGALANPTLELHDGNGTAIAFNDDWKTRPDGSSQQAEIEATTLPPSNDMESALVRRLSPGSYTAIVRGNNGGTGIGLVEVYHLP